MGRDETIEETAARVTAAGGTGIAVRVDHTVAEQVEALFQRVAADHDGRLDVVVNDIWGGDRLTNWDVPFWHHDLGAGRAMQQLGVTTHLITSHYAAQLMVARRSELVVGSPTASAQSTGATSSTTWPRRRSSASRSVRPTSCARTVSPLWPSPRDPCARRRCSSTSVSRRPTWKEGAELDPDFIPSESPHFVGRTVAHLAADPEIMAKSGQAIASWDAAEAYGFTDIDGRRSHWGRHFRDVVQARSGPELL